MVEVEEVAGVEATDEVEEDEHVFAGTGDIEDDG